MRRTGLIAAAAMALTGAQHRPGTPIAPQSGDDTVVTGRRQEPGIDLSGPVPRLKGGAWAFDRTATLVMGMPSNMPRQRFTDGSGIDGSPNHFKTCLDDDDLAGALRRMAGERSNLPDLLHCAQMRLTIKDGRISGRRLCTLSSMRIGRSHSGLSIDVSGTYDAQRLKMIMTGEESTDGLTEGGAPTQPATWSWRVVASRVGACPNDRGGFRNPADVADLIFTP